MKRTIFTIIIIAIFLGISSKAYPAISETWISNLEEPVTSNGGFTTKGWLTTSFTTDDANYILDSVIVAVAYQNLPVKIEVMIYDEIEGKPGVILETLTGNPEVNTRFRGIALTDFEEVTVFSNGLTLAPNTSYWIAVKAVPNPGILSSAGMWAITNTNNAISVGLWSVTNNYGVSFNSGETWSTGSNESYLFSVNATILSEAVVLVPIDIKPTSCPNPVNVKSKGVLPVAVLGSDVFDVNDIDPNSVAILGVQPIRYNYEDVATPADVNAMPEDCLCSTDGPDDYLDMTLKFDTPVIIEAIGEVEDGDYVVLTLTGLLKDGTPIEGTDCVLIIEKGKD